jgi:hypothetical protein
MVDGLPLPFPPSHLPPLRKVGAACTRVARTVRHEQRAQTTRLNGARMPPERRSHTNSKPSNSSSISDPPSSPSFPSRGGSQPRPRLFRALRVPLTTIYPPALAVGGAARAAERSRGGQWRKTVARTRRPRRRARRCAGQSRRAAEPPQPQPQGRAQGRAQGRRRTRTAAAGVAPALQASAADADAASLGG